MIQTNWEKNSPHELGFTHFYFFDGNIAIVRDGTQHILF